MLNKKADVPVVVFVLLTLVLTISALAIFQNNSKAVSSNIGVMNSLEEVYVRENIAKYYIFMVGSDLLNDGLLTKESFKDNFSEDIFEEPYLKNLQGKISKGEFTLENKNFQLDEPLIIAYVDEKISISYQTSLKVDFKP